jgi:hypothetical protein
MTNRTRNWAAALASWRCPTHPSNSVGECDPCGQMFDGNWAHMHCRGNSVGERALLAVCLLCCQSYCG